MAIQNINVGNAANDGTGDDLREAFIKINQNFQELETTGLSSVTGANLGTSGAEVYANTSNGVLYFRRLVGGTNITLSQFDNTIVVNSTAADSRFTISGNTGSLIAGGGIALNIVSTDGAFVTVDENSKTISIDGSLSRDTSPVLSANLDANNFDISDVDNLSAENIIPLTNINGVNYNDRLGRYIEGFDFGPFDNVSYSILDWVINQIGVDFGTFTAPSTGNVDLGNFV